MLNMNVRFGNLRPTANMVATEKADNLSINKRLRELTKYDTEQGGGSVGSSARKVNADTWSTSQARTNYIAQKEARYTEKAAKNSNFLAEKLGKILKKAGKIAK